MFQLLQTASDDQMSLGVCILTLAGAALFVFASFHLGPAGKRQRDLARQKTGLKMMPGTSLNSDRIHERAA